MIQTLTGKRLIVVDDEEDLRQVLADEFQAHGCLVSEASSGQEALAMIQRASPAFDLVVSDLRMPNGDGIELLRELRDRDPFNPPLTLITAYADIAESEAFELGAYGVFPKPFDRESLIRTLARAVAPWSERYIASAEDPVPASTVRMQYVNLTVAAELRLLRFGQGGFYARLPRAQAIRGTRIAFEMSFSDGAPARLSGTGLIRWSHAVLPGDPDVDCGIELLSLDAPSALALEAHLEHTRPRAFIPRPAPSK